MPTVKVYGSNKQVSLNTKQLIGSGGEGDIYAVKNIAYKITTNGHPLELGKFQELSVLKNNPHFISPLELLTDTKNNICGYTMPLVNCDLPLQKTFTNSWRNKNPQFTNDICFKLIQQLAQDISWAHSNNILLVDINPLNFLITQDYSNLLCIDTNSYQTRSYPATAIMESVKDYLSNTLSELTDWYSFAIVSFEFLIGIHPFDGTHPTLKSREDKIRRGLSILGGKLSYPLRACRDLDIIPSGYRAWYHSIFEEKKRLAPPTDPVAKLTAFKTRHQSITAEKVKFTEIKEANYDNYVYYNGQDIAYSSEYIPLYANGWKLLKKSDMDLNKTITYMGQGFTIKQGHLYKISHSPILNQIVLEHMFEVSNITAAYEGCYIQTVGGAHILTTFPADKQIVTIKLGELSKFRAIVDGKFDKGYAYFVGVDKYGNYVGNLFKFDSSYETYTYIEIDGVHNIANMATIDNGLCILNVKKGEIEIHSKTTSRLVKDDKLDIVTLLERGKLHCIDNNKLLLMELM